jgi:hypothetical protein
MKEIRFYSKKNTLTFNLRAYQVTTEDDELSDMMGNKKAIYNDGSPKHNGTLIIN